MKKLFSSRRRSVALLLVGIMFGGLLISPAGAHVNERVGHLWGHIRPRVIALIEGESRRERATSDAKYERKIAATGCHPSLVLQRVGSTYECGFPHFENENNGSHATATAFFLANRYAFMTLGDEDHDYWRIQHPGGNLRIETLTETCKSTVDPFGDTVMTLFASDGTTQLAQNDDIDGVQNACSRIEGTRTAGTYFVRVRAFGCCTGGTAQIPWVRLEVVAG